MLSVQGGLTGPLLTGPIRHYCTSARTCRCRSIAPARAPGRVQPIGIAKAQALASHWAVAPRSRRPFRHWALYCQRTTLQGSGSGDPRRAAADVTSSPPSLLHFLGVVQGNCVFVRALRATFVRSHSSPPGNVYLSDLETRVEPVISEMHPSGSSVLAVR